MTIDPWHGWLNAEVYASFTDRTTLYSELNRALTRAANLQEARNVLDLGCGTGATTRACLAHLPPEARILGIDASEAMIEVARTRIQDPRARFDVAGASLEGAAPGPFDRVLCNAAFWQFPAPRAVLEAVAQRLLPQGIFVFNVPGERVAGAPQAIHPFQASLARAIERVAGRKLSEPPVILEPERLREWAAEEGMRLEHHVWTWRGDQGELMDLMEIPAMIEPLTPELAPELRTHVVTLAREDIDPEEPVEVPWVVFRASRSS